MVKIDQSGDGGVRSIEEARAFVEQVGLCAIFHDPSGKLPSLWDAVDAPDKQPGERGWGDKMGKVWSWKNELPARYPDAIFYGKLKGGRAILCTMARLREIYREQHSEDDEERSLLAPDHRVTSAWSAAAGM